MQFNAAQCRLWMQAIRRHEQADALRGMLGRYLELLTDRLVAAPADISRLPQLHAAMGAHAERRPVLVGAGGNS